jgi:RloB-like protein
MSRKDRSQPGKGDSNRKVGNRELTPTFLIVCEGKETEPNYFKCFPVKTRPKIKIVGLGRQTVQVVNKALELSKETKFDRVWCVFDRDPSRDETYDNFNKALQLAKNEGISVAYSHECFEIWYLLHFNFYDTPISRKDYQKKLKKLLDMDYEKNSEDMYDILKVKQPKAIQHARTLLSTYDPHDPASDNPATTVHLLVEELNKYIH